MTIWKIVDKQGRKQSRITFTSIQQAIQYKRILATRFPEYDWVIVKGEQK